MVSELKRKKILIVDDEVDLVEVNESLLTANGYEVITAYDGLEGLKIAREEKPDLIILDLNMPKLDGYQVCRLIKFDTTLNNIPIIMLTARDKNIDKAQGEEVKVDLYLTKPYEIEELLQSVKGFIGI